jgi:hypothetical protein
MDILGKVLDSPLKLTICKALWNPLTRRSLRNYCNAVDRVQGTSDVYVYEDSGKLPS